MDLLASGRTFREIQQFWVNCSLNESRKPMDRKTFYNWRNYIADHYGEEVRTYLAGRDTKYQIVRKPGDGHVRDWLTDTISVQNALLSNSSVRDRILLEDVPSGRQYLELILGAMKSNRVVSFDYRDYWEDKLSLTIYPYFVKLFRQHWKVCGPVEGEGEDSIRSYALDADRMSNLKVLDRNFEMPEDYDPKEALAYCIGTTLMPKSVLAPQVITLLVWAKYNWYLKSVPLHHSQELCCDCPEDGYSIFRYCLVTSEDFYQEICRYGDHVEVLSPANVRDEMCRIIKSMQDGYDGKHRASSKVKNPLLKF